MRTYQIRTYGCQMNFHDSERLAGLLEEAGYQRARSGEAKTSSRTSRQDISSGRRGGLRSGTSRATGRTKEQLYQEARRMGIEGRSKMNKAQLQRAVAGAS